MIKKGVKINGLKPEILLAYVIVQAIYASIGCDCVITEITGGKHGVASFHYVGQAIDLRMHNVPDSKRSNLVKTIRIGLGENYDVVWEGKGTSNEHLHIEYQPK